MTIRRPTQRPANNKNLRFLLAPNSFRECLNACEVVEAMKEGLRRVIPQVELIEMPLADGGDGTLDAMARIYATDNRVLTVCNPLGQSISARFLMTKDGRTAIIEMAEASGLRRVDAAERDVWNSSTYGTGQLIRAALDLGVKRIMVGVGGSATLDGGAGALAALGARFHDATGNPLAPTPRGLAALARVDLTNLDSRLANVDLVALSDVDTPLAFNSRTFGIQKGIQPNEFDAYDRSVRLFAACGRNGEDILHSKWCGAGGGLAGGLRAFAGARVVAGAETIVRLARLRNRLRHVSAVLTGEGQLDHSSFPGKLPIVISEIASRYEVPCMILVGRIIRPLRKRLPPFSKIFSVQYDDESLRDSISQAAARITKLSEDIGRAFYIQSS